MSQLTRLRAQLRTAACLACAALTLQPHTSTAAASDTDTTHRPIAVTVTGDVHRPGEHHLAPDARLFDAAQAAGVRPDAYLTGAAWLHKPAEAAQHGLKAGILHDLTLIVAHARLANIPARADLALRLRAQIELLPVTGRRAVSLDPVRLELERRHNRPVADGDQLHYPKRPDSVTVHGAVIEDCTLPFVALKPAADYAQECPAHAEADADWLYIIQPDGHTQRHGIAPWNRDPAQPLAPGAQLLRGFRPLGEPTVAPSMNAELAAFLATQALPRPELAQ